MYFTAYSSLVYEKWIKPRKVSQPSTVESPSTPAPGTIKLQDSTLASGARRKLHPMPTSDPNDPLNWSNGRKALNFGLTCFYVVISFVVSNINGPAYNSYIHDLGVSFSIYTASNALSFAGFAVGCFLFVPFIHKYGRRPLYLLSLTIQTTMTIWAASMKGSSELIPVSFLLGVGSALSEVIIQSTVNDLFFVHQRARMNGIFMFMQTAGPSLGSVIAGLIVERQGWRWMWWWCTIIVGAILLVALIAFEETKYIPGPEGQGPAEPLSTSEKETYYCTETSPPETAHEVDHRRRLKPYRQRLALISPTPGNISHHFYQPLLVLFRFPAVAYAAITYGIVISWVTVLGTVEASQLILPPWNFSPTQVGLIRLAPFTGDVLGTIVAGTLSDYSIIRLAARNNGVFEPEMRLWVALPGGLISFTGLLLFGFAMANREHWILIAVGHGLYTGGLIFMTTTAIVGDALVAVVWVRNLCSMVIMFALPPWLDGMGIQNTFLVVAFIGLAIFTIPIALILWGKRARISTAEMYQYFTQRQAASRPV